MIKNSKHKKIILYAGLLFLVVISFVSGCSPEEDTKPTESKIVEQATPEQNLAEELWRGDLQSFREWQLVTGTSEKMKGKGWHSELATIRGNSTALDAMKSENTVLPDGSILVKENFDAGEGLVNIVTLKKIEGRWYWSQFSTAGIPEITGFNVSKCLQCHTMTPNDSVFSWKKRRQ